MLKIKQKGFIPVVGLVVIFLLLALGGTIYYSQSVKKQKTEEKKPALSSTPVTVEELFGWQEYLNDRYHYKIKYPGDWYFIKEGYSPPPPTAIKLSSISDPYPSADVDYLSVEIDVDKALGRTLDNYEEIVNLKSQYYQDTRLTVGGAPAAKIAVPDLNSSEPISVYILHKDYIYRIVWSDNTDNFVQDRKLFEKILQSFSFND